MLHTEEEKLLSKRHMAKSSGSRTGLFDFSSVNNWKMCWFPGNKVQLGKKVAAFTFSEPFHLSILSLPLTLAASKLYILFFYSALSMGQYKMHTWMILLEMKRNFTADFSSNSAVVQEGNHDTLVFSPSFCFVSFSNCLLTCFPRLFLGDGKWKK